MHLNCIVQFVLMIRLQHRLHSDLLANFWQKGRS